MAELETPPVGDLAGQAGATEPPAAEPKRQSMRDYIAERADPARTSAPVSGTGEPPESAEQKATREEAEQAEANKAKGGWQRRIDKLTKQKSELSELLETERTTRQTLEARLAGKPAETAKEPAGLRSKPTPNDADDKGKAKYATYEDFVDDLTDWKVEQRFHKQQEIESEQSEQARLQQTFDAHLTRLAEAKKHFSDWDEVVEGMAEGEMKIPHAAGLAIVELENGPEIAYHLAKHPELREKLHGLHSDVAIVAEVGRLAASLAKDVKSAPPKAALVSRAPAPIEPVGGSSAQSAVPLDKMRMRDYMKARREGRLR